MTSEPRAEVTTILFTDLVGSTELVQRVGDEAAQQIVEAHHRLVSDLVASHGGAELQWLGDGLMAAFASAADAVRGAIAVQRAVRQASTPHPLAIRIGLNVGEILRQETGSGYFGTPVVVARRLCDRAEADQILCSALVAGMLSGRKAFRFQELGRWTLKGIAIPIEVSAVVYEIEGTHAACVGRTPFVGRDDELRRLSCSLDDARAGRGGLAMVTGEPGIGKTRLLEALAERARADDVRILWGRCYEGQSVVPYGAFAEALEDLVPRLDVGELREDLGDFGAVITRIVPALRRRLPDLPELPVLQPDEERYRLFEAVARLLGALAARAPVLLVLDDLHWADAGTVAMLAHAARAARRAPLVIVGAYREGELDRRHPMADAAVMLRREVGYERIRVRGLETAAVAELLEAIAARRISPELADAINHETDGNPFFVREILLHLLEEGKLLQDGGVWVAAAPIEQLGIPEGVREVIGRRLARLSDDANRLLTAASAFNGAFRFDIAARAADLAEAPALDALDAALDTRIVSSGDTPESYDFTHALIRHTLYAEMSPSRQVRMHRRIADTMGEVYGDTASAHAEEIAQQFYRSAALPGAERGVPSCLAAADRAEGAAAHGEACTYLEMALELLPATDARRPRLLGRRALALAWSLRLDEATNAATEAGALIAAAEGDHAAAGYLAEAADAIWLAGFTPRVWRLAEQGLRYAADRRDATWARLMHHELARREALDAENPGMSLDSPERRELARVVASLGDLPEETGFDAWRWVVVGSRDEILASTRDDPGLLGFWAGEYRRALKLIEETTLGWQQRGRIVAAAFLGSAQMARLHGALGDLAASRAAYAQAQELSSGLRLPAFVALQMGQIPIEWALVTGDGFEPLIAGSSSLLEHDDIENRWVTAVVRAILASFTAKVGDGAAALRWLAAIVPAIEKAPGWTVNYTLLIHLAAETLWDLARTDHCEVIEANLRAKTLASDFRYPHADARLSLARLCALQGRGDEAAQWFARARAVLDEQGARPLRAVTDFDEALMCHRRDATGDRERAAALFEAALARFREIGMPGWQRRAEELQAQCEKRAP